MALKLFINRTITSLQMSGFDRYYRDWKNPSDRLCTYAFLWHNSYLDNCNAKITKICGSSELFQQIQDKKWDNCILWTANMIWTEIDLKKDFVSFVWSFFSQTCMLSSWLFWRSDRPLWPIEKILLGYLAEDFFEVKKLFIFWYKLKGISFSYVAN